MSRRDKLRAPIRAEEQVQWLPGSLGAVYPRVEDLFCNAAALRRKEESRRVRVIKARLAGG